jgi:hypothetical protein
MARKVGRRLLVAASCGALTVLVGAGTAHAAPRPGPSSAGPVVVVSGLNNPRQLSLVHDDVLLVAEAGKGGTLATITSPDGSTQGLGYTGSVSAVLAPAWARNQQPHRIVRGLLSAAALTNTPQGPKGSGATGPDGVSALSLNRIAVVETFFGPAAPPAARALDGHLLLTTPYGPVRPLADISGFERKYDPDRKGFDSNPYAVLAYRGGWLVADAAGNDVLQVNRSGRISVFHVFPNVTTGPCAKQFDPAPPFAGCNFVPTSLATDGWGNVYVGGLSGLTPGQGQVVKLDAVGRVLKVWTGFTSVTGLAVGDDGSLYVSQLFATEAHPANPMIQGVVTRIHGGHRSNMDVPFPAGLAVDNSNNVYVSAFSILPDTGAGIPGVNTSGQVWRVRF